MHEFIARFKNVTNTQTYIEILYICVSETESIYNIYICLSICWITYFLQRVFYKIFAYLLFVCIEEMLFFFVQNLHNDHGASRIYYVHCTILFRLFYGFEKKYIKNAFNGVFKSCQVSKFYKNLGFINKFFKNFVFIAKFFKILLFFFF